jgi:hypothetical protein
VFSEILDLWLNIFNCKAIHTHTHTHTRKDAIFGPFFYSKVSDLEDEIGEDGKSVRTEDYKK